jgi:hypothetical protein
MVDGIGVAVTDQVNVAHSELFGSEEERPADCEILHPEFPCLMRGDIGKAGSGQR